jgi:flagellar basal-body rod modification protein FlgD
MVANVSSSLGVQQQQPVVRTGTNELQRDDFMKLLVAQLKNQDPENPADSKELITQLSQLTSVEQLVAMSDKLSQLEVGLASVANTQVSDIVGKRVEAETKSVFLADTGSSSVPYTIDGRAQEVTITLRDADGTIVRKQTLGPTFPGSRSFTWDGNDDGGQRLPVGRYTVEVAAKNATGGVVGASTRVSGDVTSIDYSKGYPELVVGEARVMLGDVTSIGQ